MVYDMLLLNVTRDINDISSGFLDCIGLHSIASYLSIYNYKVKVYSGDAAQVTKVIQNEILKNKVAIIGFYTATDNLIVVKNIIKWIKYNFDVTTIVGGPEAVILKKEFLKETNCDFIMEGEGEVACIELMEYLIDKTRNIEDVHSIRYIDAIGQYKENELSELIDDLDTIPYPKKENSLNLNFRNHEMVGIITGRGCPYHCSFCYEGANAKKVRFRSIDNVMDEIDCIIENNKNLKYINIYDDTFTLNKERIIEFCKEIKKRNILWFCEAHVNNIIKNPEILDIMIDAGLTNIQIGIESGSNKVLSGYNKNITAGMILKVVETCKQKGITGITGNFIIGGAFESSDTIKESMELAKNIISAGRGIVEIHTVFLAPYPNTAISLYPENFDITIHKELLEKNLTSMRTPVISTKNLSVKEIVEWKIKFDEFLNNEYDKNAMISTKEDLKQSYFFKNKYLDLNYIWHSRYRNIEYINNFIKNYCNGEMEFNEKLYPIRTFDMLNYDQENNLLIGNYKFNNKEKEFLELSNGSKTIFEIMNILDIDIISIKNIFNKLNNKCMVYLSQF